MRASRRRIRARMNPGSDRDAERSTDESRRGPLRDARARSAADAAPRDDEAWRAPSFKTAPGAARGALRARQSCCNFFRSPLSFPRRFASPRSDKRRARPPTRSSPRGAPSSRAPWRSPRSGFPPRSLADALARTLVRPRPGAASRDLARLPPRRHPSAPRPPPAPSLSRRDALALALLGAFAAPASAPPAASAASSDAAGLARLARLEPDPEVAVAIWDDVLDLASAAAAAAAPPTPTRSRPGSPPAPIASPPSAGGPTPSARTRTPRARGRRAWRRRAPPPPPRETPSPFSSR